VTGLCPEVQNHDQESMKRRILFVHRGGFSGINQSLLNEWRAAEPETEFVFRDLDVLYFNRPLAKWRALPHLLRNAGLKVVLRKGEYQKALRRSSYYWDRIIEIARRVYQQERDYDFGISIGTVLPIINPAFPVFIYTDNTIITNLHYHDDGERYRSWQPFLPMERQAISSATRVFTMSNHVSRTVVDDYDVATDRVICVKAGSNVPPVQESSPDRFTRRNILFVGLDWERKGGPDLVKAFRILKERLPDVTLTLVGADPQGIAGDGIEVLGRRPPAEVAKLMANASVFAMPSLREPFGIVFLEAMHAGMAVIACRLGAPPDFIEEGVTGFLVEPGNVGEIADALFQILKDPEKAAEMGRRAKTRVSEEYTWKAVYNRMSAAIEAAIVNTASSPLIQK
jgi:glycosyltransferase involved in cell wall biosynthesis